MANDKNYIFRTTLKPVVSPLKPPRNSYKLPHLSLNQSGPGTRQIRQLVAPEIVRQTRRPKTSSEISGQACDLKV